MKAATRLLIPLMAVAASSTAPVPLDRNLLEPSGKWIVSGEEGLCVLSRAYHLGSTDIQFGIRPLGSEDKTEVVLLASRSGGGIQFGTGAVRLDGGPRTAAPYVSRTFEKPAQRVTTLTVKSDLAAALGDAQALTVEAGATTVTFHLVNIAPALKALAQCEDLLLERWGVDPAGYHAETAHPKMTNVTAFGPDKYPPEALRSGAQGRTVAVLKITPDGHADDCRVVASAGNAALDHATCAVALHDLHFTPARGVDGRTIGSFFILPVRWLLPLD